MQELKGKVALVTSAGRGIGWACALRLASAGAQVFLGVRRVEETQQLCLEQGEAGSRMKAVFFDATQLESYNSMAHTAAKATGHIDILVNNFGVGRPGEDGDLVNGSEQAFFSLMDLNVGSVYRISRAVIPYMLQQGGSIINISSIGGVLPDVTRIGYGVSKAAINNLTQQIALQYARHGVRCNAVLPGLTATDAALGNMPQEFIQSFLKHVPLGRIGRPEDIAGAVLFFAGEDSGYITGHLLEVAGGYGLGTPQYADAVSGFST